MSDNRPLVSLRVENFRALREVDVEFPDGLIGIVGRNGRGKSSLLKAIAFGFWSMTGVPNKWRKERLITRDAEAMRVELTFTVAGDTYTVIRKMARKGLVIEASLQRLGELDEAGQPKILTGNDIVTGEIIRLVGAYDKQSISRFVSQKEVNALTVLDPAPRKRLILGLLGVEGVEGAIKALRDNVTEFDRTIKSRKAVLPEVANINASQAGHLARQAELAGVRAALEAELAAAQAAARAATAELAERDRIFEAVSALATTLEILDSQIADLVAEDGRIDAHEAEIAAAGPRLAEVEARLAQVEAHRAELAAAEESAALRRRAPELREQQVRLTAQIADDKRALAEMERQAGQLKAREAEERKLEVDLRTLADAFAAAEGERGERRAELQRIKAELTAIRAQIAAIGVEPVGACPTCGQAIADEEAFRAHLAVRQADLEAQEQRVTTTGIAAKARSDDAAARRAAAETRLTALRAELETSRAAAGDLRMARASLESYETQYAQNTADLAALEAMPYDEARHGLLVAEAEAQPELIGLRGELRAKIAETDSVAVDRARVAERRTGYEARRAEAESAASAAGYDREAHQGAKLAVAATAAEVHRLDLALAELAGQENLVVAELAHDDDEMRKHGAMVAEIDAILSDRAVVELARQAMDRFKIELIGRIRPALSRKASELLREMTDGEYADLVLDEDYGISIGNGPLLWEPGEPSGGEDDLANLCLRLAISELINESSGVGPSFVILDEVLGSQDDERRELVMAALPRLAGHFRQMLMVAHVPGVQDRFPVVIDAEWDPVTRTSRFIYPPRENAQALPG